jgi:DNA ligase-4
MPPIKKTINKSLKNESPPPDWEKLIKIQSSPKKQTPVEWVGPTEIESANEHIKIWEETVKKNEHLLKNALKEKPQNKAIINLIKEDIEYAKRELDIGKKYRDKLQSKKEEEIKKTSPKIKSPKNMDYDDLCKFWIKSIPYIYVQGEDIENSFRYYILNESDYENVKKYNLGENFSLINKCPNGWVHNYFLLYNENINVDFENIRIEGIKINIPDTIKNIKDLTVYLKIPMFSFNVVKKYEEISQIPELPFVSLCLMLEKIKNEKKEGKKIILKKFFGLYNKSKNASCSVILKLLLPQTDKTRYNLGENKLGKVYIKLLGISPDSLNAKRILDWKKPTKSGYKFESFGSVLVDSIKNYIGGGSSGISVGKIYDFLMELALAKDKNTDIFRKIINKLSLIEHKYLINIILKDGISERLVLDTFHKNAYSLFNSTSDVDYVCSQLFNLKSDQDYKGNFLTLFKPIKPMLASRRAPEKLPFEEKNKCYILETKFDGERLQIHKDKKKIKLYSRQGNDVTELYQSIIPSIIKNVTYENCILDGEILVWDKNLNKFDEFGSLKPNAKFFMKEKIIKKTIDSDNYNKQIVFVSFDILYRNNESLIELPLRARYTLLNSGIRPNDIIRISEQKIICKREEFITEFNKILEKKEEGLMLKTLDSQYYPGFRSNGWIKVKPAYIKDIGDELDLIIIGGYYSDSNKRGNVSRFLMGVYDNIKSKYLSFVKVGTGYSVHELKLLQEELEDSWIPYNDKSIPEDVILGKEKPDLLIEPLNSRVLSISGHQFIFSDQYATSITLRFPTSKKIRYDKDHKDVTTLDEILELEKEYGSLATQSLDINSLEPGEYMPKSRRKKEYKLLEHFKPADLRNIEIKTDLFKGMEIYVMSGDKTYSKQKFEEMIYENGGKLTQNPTKDTKYIITEKETFKVKNLMDKNIVLKNQWVLDSIKENKLINIDDYKFKISKTTKAKTIFKPAISIGSD